MIGMLRGTVWTTESDRVVLDVGGVGYLLHVPSGYLVNMRQGEEKVFYTHLLVREDDLTLIGFYQLDEKALFLQLLGVSGVGPKAALAMISAFPVNQLKSAIVREDASLLTSVPGIGGKIAKRLILELKEKMKDIEPAPDVDAPVSLAGRMNEALDTLMALGFTRNEARDALSKIDGKEDLTTEEQIKEALRFMAVTQ